MPRSVFDCSRLTGRAKSLQLQTPLTLNQPDEWAVSQGVAGRAYYHLWRSISRILFSLSLSAVMSSGADFDTLWHCSQARLCCASIVQPVPKQPNVLQELLDGPKAWLAPITAWGLSHVLSAPHLLVLCRNIIRMRMHSMIVCIGHWATLRLKIHCTANYLAHSKALNTKSNKRNEKSIMLFTVVTLCYCIHVQNKALLIVEIYIPQGWWGEYCSDWCWLGCDPSVLWMINLFSWKINGLEKWCWMSLLKVESIERLNPIHMFSGMT